MTELNDHSTRDHALLSASSAARWLSCPPSAIAAEAYPPEPTEYTLEGTLAHEVAEAILTGKEVTPQKEITFEMLDCANLYRDYIENLKKSDDSVILTEQKVDFSPWVPEGFGTCDCIILQGNTLTVIDFKYGQGVAVAAGSNPQLRLYALGALNDYGHLIDVELVEMHIVQPRIENYSHEVIHVDDLREWGETIKPIAEKAFKGEGEYSAGMHCKFCPHAGKCRELHRVCTMFIEHNSQKFEIPTLAPHELSDVLRMEPLISMWLKRTKDQAFKEALKGSEIPGYKIVEGRQGNRKWIDEADAIEKIKAENIDTERFIETKLVSPAQFEKAIGKKNAKALLESLTERAPGAPSLVKDTDYRPAFSSYDMARNDFAD